MRVSDAQFRKKGSHIVLGNRLWKEGKRVEAAEHFRQAAEIEDKVLGQMIGEERDDWVVNAVSLLSCLRKSGDKGKEQKAADDCKKLLETMPLDEQWASYARKIKRWKVKP